MIAVCVPKYEQMKQLNNKTISIKFLKLELLIILQFVSGKSLAQHTTDSFLQSFYNVKNEQGEVFIENLGETFRRIVPYTGWSEITKGVFSHVLPWRLEYFIFNPYDDHPYLNYRPIFGGNQSYDYYQRDYYGDYPKEDNKVYSNGIYYKVVNGYLYSGEYTDSIEAADSYGRRKEISFKANYKNGILDGLATFYFTSKGNEYFNKFNKEIAVGEIKSQGEFKNGKRNGMWIYYGYPNYLILKHTSKIKEYIYKEDNVQPIKGIEYELNVNNNEVVSLEWEQMENVLQYHKEYDKSGILTKYLRIIKSENQIANLSDTAEYEESLFYENIMYAKGNWLYIQQKTRYRQGVWEFFNKNGILIERGEFNNEETRVGKWDFFYDSGERKCIRLYKNENDKLLEYWDEAGNHLVKNGNGEIRTILSKEIKIETVKNGEIITTFKKI